MVYSHSSADFFLMFQGVWKMILNFETVLWALQLIPEQTVWILCIPKSCSTCAWLGRRSLKALGQQRKTCSTQRIKGFDVIPLELPAASIGFKRVAVFELPKQQSNLQLLHVCVEGEFCASLTHRFSKNCTHWSPLPVPLHFKFFPSPSSKLFFGVFRPFPWARWCHLALRAFLGWILFVLCPQLSS